MAKSKPDRKGSLCMGSGTTRIGDYIVKVFFETYYAVNVWTFLVAISCNIAVIFHVRTADAANVAFVALLSGLSRAWVQPSVFAVAQTKLCAENIRWLLLALIEQLRECRLFVMAVVCNKGFINVQLFEQLNLTPKIAYFEVCGEKVYTSLFKLRPNEVHEEQALIPLQAPYLQWNCWLELH